MTYEHDILIMEHFHNCGFFNDTHAALECSKRVFELTEKAGGVSTYYRTNQLL